MSKGYSADEVYNQYYDGDIEKTIRELVLNDIKKQEIEEKIKEIKEDKYENSYERGAALENLIEDIMNSSKIFNCIKNKHTTSNEFDILVKLNFHGRALRARKIIPSWIPDKFLIECKNKKTPANVELVGKFYSLIKQSNISLGIFICKSSISGKYDKKKNPEKYWKDAHAFIHKINLKYSEAKDPTILIDLDLNDIELVLNSSILEIIESRKDQIEMDVNENLNEWVCPHENEGKFNI